MHSFTQIKRFFAFGLLASTTVLSSMQATASSTDLATLQAKVDNYVSSSVESEIDSLLSSYGGMKLGQTYTADSPVPPQVDNTDATWKKMTYTTASASQLIGYADDQCAAHTTYEQLIAKGVKVDQAKFNNTRDKFCKLVNAAAELKHRYDKYQSIKTNGVVLVKRSKSQEHDFKGHHRTFGGGIDLVYKPDIANTLQNGIHPDQTFQYNSWIKWSDDGRTNLDIIKKIREMNNAGAEKCDGFAFQIIDGGVRAWLFMDVVNVTSTNLTIKNCMRVAYNNTHKSHSFPEVNMQAPFGYLYELEQMKDGAKAQLKDKVKDKVTSMIGANQEMVSLLKLIK